MQRRRSWKNTTKKVVVRRDRGRVALLVQARDRLTSSAKLLAPHVATRIWAHAYGPFEYPGEDPSVGCTSHPWKVSIDDSIGISIDTPFRPSIGTITELSIDDPSSELYLAGLNYVH
ncbi:hypothetical protein YC2023_114617 [Brassica napus]